MVLMRFVLVLLNVFCLVFNTLSQSRLDSVLSEIDKIVYEDVFQASDMLPLAESLITDEIERAYLLKRKAIIARIRSKYNEALNSNLEALEIFEKNQLREDVAEIYHNMGYLMRYMKDFPKAIELFQNAIRLRETLNDSTDLALSHRELGVIYRKSGDLDMALHHYDCAKKLFDPIKDKREVLTLQGNYATIYYVQKQYAKAIHINQEALSVIRGTNDMASLCTRYGNIASAYLKMDSYDKALIYVDSALTIATASDLLEDQVRYSSVKAKINYERKAYKEAYNNMRTYRKLNQKLVRTAIADNSDAQLKAFEYEKQIMRDSIEMANVTAKLNDEIKVEQLKKRSLLWISIIIALSLLAAWFWQMSRTKMAELKSEYDQLSAVLLQDKLDTTEKENERLINESHLHYEFKKSILEKIDNIKLDTKHADPSIRDLQRELLNQMRIENEAKVLNESIHDYPAAFDEYLRETYPSLTKGERKVCFLVKSEMSIKEIANINQTSSSAIQSMRYRVRKKLALAKGEELKSFLQNLQWRKV